MTTLLNFVLPAEWLVQGMNAALAALLACAAAVAASRCRAWPLPTRHALLVAALAISVAAPLVSPFCNLPSPWTISLPAASVEPQTMEVAANPSAALPAVAVSSDSVPISTAETNSAPTPMLESDPPPAVATVVNETPAAEIRAQHVAQPIPWLRLAGTVLCGLWFVGIVVGLARAVLSLMRLRRWFGAVSLADDAVLTSAVRRAADRIGLRDPVAVYSSNVLPAPVIFGLLRPRIVVPAGIESELTFEQLQAVMQHELAHLARRDLWIGLLQQIVQIVHWWNPVVHLANRQLADLREQICDDIATRDLAEPEAFASTLIQIADRCSDSRPIPATLGIGSSPIRQLEARIRRILSSPRGTSFRLSRRSAFAVSAFALVMTVTILLAEVQLESPPVKSPPADAPQSVAVAQTDAAAQVDDALPSLAKLIKHIAAYERAYLSFDIQSMETFRMSDELTPLERKGFPWGDGRKHQRLMEYAQWKKRIWRQKSTQLIDGVAQKPGPHESFSDGERRISVSPESALPDANGKRATRVHIDKKFLHDYLYVTPLQGVFCLASHSDGGLLSEMFKNDEDAIQLAWDGDDAKLTFLYGDPGFKTRFHLWLSREHAWHPFRLQWFFLRGENGEKLFHGEWEVTKFVKQGNVWRVAEGTHRTRGASELKLPPEKIKYSLDFKILAAKYEDDVDEKQFHYVIPKDAVVDDDNKPKEEPPPSGKTRAITVSVVDVAKQPVPDATIRLRTTASLRELDRFVTDASGAARTDKVPEGIAMITIEAENCRPASIAFGENVADVDIYLAPQTTGVAVDESDETVAGAWVSNQARDFRADGFYQVPDRQVQGRNEDWSDREGRFVMKTNLTLRPNNDKVTFIAIDPKQERMAIQVVPAADLGRPLELMLQPVCAVEGQCLLEGVTELIDVRPQVYLPTGETVAGVTARRELTPEGLRFDYRLRLPPGDYVLKARRTSQYAEIKIPFGIDRGETELDLGTAVMPPGGPASLKDKPAPDLAVRWRPGEETSWEKLRGKVVVLNFWGLWCPPCIEEMPELMELADQFQGKPVAWIAIHTGEIEDFAVFDQRLAKCIDQNWNKRKPPFALALDRPLREPDTQGETHQRYGIAEWSTLIVVDQKGNVVGPVQKKNLGETIQRLLDRGNDK